MYLFIKNMSWYINIIILKTMQQTRTFFCVPFFFFFSCDLNTPSKLSPPTERTFFLEAALWHFPSSVFKFFSALHPVSFFPVFRLFSFLSVFLWQPSFIWAVLRYLPRCLLLSPLPLLCTLLPLPFLFPAFFSLTSSCLHSHRHGEDVRVDSCRSHLCSPVGRRWSGAAGDWANHLLCAPPAWQWPEGKWSPPYLEIWPALRYVLTETHT